MPSWPGGSVRVVSAVPSAAAVVPGRVEAAARPACGLVADRAVFNGVAGFGIEGFAAERACCGGTAGLSPAAGGALLLVPSSSPASISIPVSFIAAVAHVRRWLLRFAQGLWQCGQGVTLESWKNRSWHWTGTRPPCAVRRCAHSSARVSGCTCLQPGTKHTRVVLLPRKGLLMLLSQRHPVQPEGHFLPTGPAWRLSAGLPGNTCETGRKSFIGSRAAV